MWHTRKWARKWEERFSEITVELIIIFIILAIWCGDCFCYSFMRWTMFCISRSLRTSNRKNWSPTYWMLMIFVFFFVVRFAWASRSVSQFHCRCIATTTAIRQKWIAIKYTTFPNGFAYEFRFPHFMPRKPHFMLIDKLSFIHHQTPQLVWVCKVWTFVKLKSYFKPTPILSHHSCQTHIRKLENEKQKCKRRKTSWPALSGKSNKHRVQDTMRTHTRTAHIQTSLNRLKWFCFCFSIRRLLLFMSCWLFEISFHFISFHVCSFSSMMLL